METSLQKYLDKAVGVLEHFGISLREGEESRLAALLQEVTSVDPARVSAIAKTLQYASTFNQLVRENVEDIRLGDRYKDITSLFDSVRDDAKTMVAQLEDGKIDLKERLSNAIMKMRRGTLHQRFEKISDLYNDVSKDTAGQLEKEQQIMDAYMDFRFALKNAEILANEVLAVQEANVKTAEAGFKSASDAFTNYAGQDAAEKSRLQLQRDEATRTNDAEQKKYQLIKDIAENLTIGYNVGETLIMKLKQTHDAKEQVYRRSVTFFVTNEAVFTTLDAVYTSQRGLGESTKTLDAMTSGINQGLEDVAELGHTLEKAALKAGYGATLNAGSVQKLVDAVVAYQLESKEMIEQLRADSSKNTAEIARIVEDGKQRCQKALYNFSNKPRVLTPGEDGPLVTEAN